MDMSAASLIHYGALALTIALTSVGVAIAQGRMSLTALDALYTQPASESHISRHLLLCLVLIETSALLGLIIAILLFFNTDITAPNALFVACAQSSVVVAIGMVGCAVSNAAAMPAKASLYAIARQPFFADKIANLMLITVAIIETPIIFGFITMLMIHMQHSSINSFNDGIRLCAAGLCIGIGAIGPAIGQGLFAHSACQAISVNRSSYREIFSFALLSQSLIETPIILAFFACLLILYSPANPSDLKTLAVMAGALCIGFATIMPGVGSGRIASAACQQLSNSQNASAITRTSLLAQGLIDTLAIYGLIVGVLLIFVPA